MNRIKRFNFLAAVLGFALLALPSLAAAQSYWYFGGGFGHAGVNEGDFDDNDTAFKLLGGYAFNPNFMVEGLYADFGEQTSRFTSPGVRRQLEGDAFGLGVRGEIPLGERFGLYGRVGVAFWDGELFTTIPPGTVSDDGTDVYFGVGGRFKFNEAVSIFLDFDRFKVDPRPDDFDVDVWTLGIQFDFGRR